MKNKLTQFFKHASFSMLILFALLLGNMNVYGQQAMTVTFPEAGTKISGESASVTYNATGFGEEVTFFLYKGGSLNADNVLDSSTVQGESTTLSFTWPDTDVQLFVAAYTGDSFSPSQDSPDDYVLIAGTSESGTPFSMNRAGSRFVLTEAFDLATSEVVYLTVKLSDIGDMDVGMANAINVEYTTDGGSTFTPLTIDMHDNATANTPALDQAMIYDFGDEVDFTFELPEGAKNETTWFRINQLDVSSIGADSRTWRIDAITLDVGEAYVMSGSQADTPTFSVSAPSISVDYVLSGTTTIDEAYGGETITAKAMVNITDPTEHNYVAYLVPFTGISVGSNSPDLSDAIPLITMDDPDIDADSQIVTITGEIPVETFRSDDYDTYKVYIIPFDKDAEELIQGFDATVMFEYSTQVSGFVDAGGVIVGDSGSNDWGLLMDMDGERSVTSGQLDIPSPGTLQVWLARASDAPSLSGTEIVLEYTTDGSTFTTIETIPLNDLEYRGDGYTIYKYEGDDWPEGLDSPTSWLRIRQVGNNGDGLDDWYLVASSMVSDDNKSSDFMMNTYGYQFDVLKPVIMTEPLEITPANLAYPMNEFTFNYSIEEGEFPAGSAAKLVLERDDDVIILSEIDDVTLGTFDFKVPPIKAGDYDLYIKVLADNVDLYDYFDDDLAVSLPVLGVTIDITDVSFSNSLTLGSKVFALLGADVSVDYEVDGELGDDTEIMLSVYDWDEEEYLLLSSAEVGSSISGTLDAGIAYGNTPTLKISAGAGVFGYSFSIDYLEIDVDGDLDDSDFDDVNFSYEGADDYDLFAGAGERSITFTEIDVPQGGNLVGNIFTPNDSDSFVNIFTVLLQGSIDEGETWQDIEEIEVDDYDDDFEFYADIPQSHWSSTLQIRLIQDGEEAEDENTWYFDELYIDTPEFMEIADTYMEFEILVPTLDVADLEKDDFIIGEELIMEFNALNFPDGTEYAVIFEHPDDSREVLATTADQGEVSVDIQLPYILKEPMSLGHSYSSLVIEPFSPITPGADLFLGSTVEMTEDDILDGDGYTLNLGNNAGNGYSSDDIVFNQEGSRFVLTTAFDLTQEEGDVTLTFYRNGDTFTTLDNVNTVPRLEVSIDAGATFSALPVMEADDDDMSPYVEGYLYRSGWYVVEIPAEYVTAATHFKWSQPLNQGLDASDEPTDVWTLHQVSIVFDSDNTMSKDAYQTSDNNMYDGQDIDVGNPSVDAYSWEQVNAATVTVYNGQSFTYSWEQTNEDAVGFPEGTEFIFTLADFDDPETQEPYVIGTATSTGEFTGSVPNFITNGNHQVNVSTTFSNGDVEVDFGTNNAMAGYVAVFLQVISTEFNDPEEKVYAGTEQSFSYEIQNDVSGASDTNIYDELFYNLVVRIPNTGTAVSGYDEMLLAAQQGRGEDFVIDLPTDLYGSYYFEVKGSVDGPLAEVGEYLTSGQLGTLVADDFINISDHAQDAHSDYYWGLKDAPGFRALTTEDLDVMEAVTVSFNVAISGIAGDSESAVVFEYSTDGGATYTALVEITEDTESDMLVDAPNSENYLVTLPDEAKTMATRFRFSQEVSTGSVAIQQSKALTFGYVPEFPFQTIVDNVTIEKQTIQITSIDEDVICSDGTININYEVNGVYGPDALIEVTYKSFGATSTDDEEGTGFIFPISADSPTISLEFDSDEFDSNTELVFTLQTDGDGVVGVIDNNNADQSVKAPFTIDAVEVIAPLPGDFNIGFSIDNQDESCEALEIKGWIDSPEENYIYQFINVVTGENMGEALTYDSEAEDDEGNVITYVNFGVLTEEVTVGLIVSSGGSDGTICQTVTSTDEETLSFTKPFALVKSRTNDIEDIWPNIEAESICGASHDIALYLHNMEEFLEDGDAQVEWFVNDIGNPVNGSITSWDDDDDMHTIDLDIPTLKNFPISGDYFARITTGECSFETERISVTVSEQPVTPEVTVASGDLISCEGEIEVVLTAPGGSTFYEWWASDVTLSAAEAASMTLTVTEPGDYQVRVSDLPFGNGCSSDWSDAVTVTGISNPTFTADYQYTSSADYRNIDAEGILEVSLCDEVTIRFYENNVQGNSGLVTVMKDGAEFDKTEASSYGIVESGLYSFTYSTTDLTLSCSQTTAELDVTITETPEDKPIITTEGSVKACEEDLSVTITAPSGFSHYKWFFRAEGGTTWVEDVNVSEMLVATNVGDYKVAVGNSDVCFSGDSRIVTLAGVEVHDAPGISIVAQTQCGAATTSIEVAASVADNTYQIYNATTDMAEGDPVEGTGTLITLTSAAHDEATDFYVMATRNDGSGCAGEPSADVTGKVNNVLLRAVGNIISVQIESVNGSSTPEYDEIIWYRNGARMIQVSTDEDKITVIDDATYSVEVIFGDGTDGACSVTSNAVTLGGGAGGNVTVPEFATSIYPNPTRDEFNLKVDGEDFGEYSVQILSLSGKVVFRDSFDKQTVDFTVPISISNLKAGIYTVIINNDNINSTLRISKL